MYGSMFVWLLLFNNTCPISTRAKTIAELIQHDDDDDDDDDDADDDDEHCQNSLLCRQN